MLPLEPSGILGTLILWWYVFGKCMYWIESKVLTQRSIVIRNVTKEFPDTSIVNQFEQLREISQNRIFLLTHSSKNFFVIGNKVLEQIIGRVFVNENYSFDDRNDWHQCWRRCKLIVVVVLYFRPQHIVGCTLSNLEWRGLYQRAATPGIISLHLLQTEVMHGWSLPLLLWSIWSHPQPYWLEYFWWSSSIILAYRPPEYHWLVPYSTLWGWSWVSVNWRWNTSKWFPDKRNNNGNITATQWCILATSMIVKRWKNNRRYLHAQIARVLLFNYLLITECHCL